MSFNCRLDTEAFNLCIVCEIVEKIVEMQFWIAAQRNTKVQYITIIFVRTICQKPSNMSTVTLVLPAAMETV